MSSPIELTSGALLKALIHGNIRSIEEILEYRDSSGIPKVDLNHLTLPHQLPQTAFRVALYSSRFFEVSTKKRYEMATYILGIVDQSGNPVIDLNIKDSEGDNVLGQVMKTYQVEKLSSNHARNLVSRILNLRNSDGNRAFRINVRELIQLRDKALKDGDKFLIDLIQDLRDATGHRIVRPLLEFQNFFNEVTPHLGMRT